jgi:hypothetical protein
MSMRVIFLMTLCLLSAGESTALAADRFGDAIDRHLQEMGEAWPQAGAVTRGPARFVLGNDVWQPGRHFESGQDWLGLACDVNGCTLGPASLVVKVESWQGHYDDEPTSGQRLTFRLNGDSTATVVAWFDTKSAPTWVKPGPVPTYYSPSLPLIRKTGDGDLEASIALPNRQQAVLIPMLLAPELMHRISPGHGDSTPAVLLQLRARNKRQLLLGYLGACEGVIDPRRYLQWAGDLDRDGLADYLISFVDEDGPVHLYLSSAAKPGKLVGLAGIYLAPPFGGECTGTPGTDPVSPES